MTGALCVMVGAGFPALSVSVSPSSVSGSANVLAPANATATTNTTTATPTGGVAPFTYLWSYVSGTVASIGSSTSATTDFSRTAFVSSPGETLTFTGVYRCTVTDSIGQTASANVTVETIHRDVS